MDLRWYREFAPVHEYDMWGFLKPIRYYKESYKRLQQKNAEGEWINIDVHNDVLDYSEF